MAKIIGLGEWFPDTVRTNADWSPELVKTFAEHLQRELVDIVDSEMNTDQYSAEGFKSEMTDPFVGSVERRVAEFDFPSYEAEILAAEDAIQKAGIDRKEIGVIYSWSVIPDIVNLNAASLIGKRLGIDDFCGFGFEGACASPIGQLMIAKSLVDTGEMKYCLLTQSHLMTRSFPLSHPASPNLGDAATAIIVGPDSHEGHEILTTHARSHGEHYGTVAWKRKEEPQSWLLPGGSYYLGTFDRKMAKELVQMTVKMGAQTTIEALNKINLTPADLDFFISVNPRKWIPAAIVKYMGLTEDKTLNTFEKYAHLGGCGPVANLLEAEKRNLLKKDDIVAVYAQGTGFVRSSLILRW